MNDNTNVFLFEQYAKLRSIIQDKFNIECVTTYIMPSNDNDTYTYFEGSHNDSEHSELHTDISSPKVVYNKKGLLSSIDHKSKALFYIPLNIRGIDIKFIMILETQHYKRIVGKEKLIYKEVFDLKNTVEEIVENVLNNQDNGGCTGEYTVGREQ